MKQTTHIVIYKDNAKSRPLYFGPFVSATIAYEFVSGLPEPGDGGLKKVTITQPYTHDETDLVRKIILKHRKPSNVFG